MKTRLVFASTVLVALTTQATLMASAVAQPTVITESATTASGLRGVILDQSTGAPLPAVTITILQGSNQVATSELDGTFFIALPPGLYAVNFFMPQYESLNQTMKVAASGPVDEAISLVPTEESTETIEIIGKVDTRTESASLATRRAASVVSDIMSAQEMGRSASSSATDAMKRVVSVSIVDNKYVALRGLEGRYVTALLNGVVLPSTEPDRNAVPLDLFPTSLLANLTVAKSYGAELPGQFGGGALSIDTNSFPTKFEAKLGLSTSANSSTLGQSGFLSGGRSGLEFFGYDAGRRQLPNQVPQSQAVRGMADEQLTSIGRSFSNNWTPTEQTVVPNLGINGTLGGTTKLAKRRFGYLATGMFRHGFNGKQGDAAKTSLVDGALQQTDTLNYRVGETESTIGTLANVGFQLAENHDINLFGLYSHIGTDMASSGGGFSESDSSNIDTSRVSFVERALGMAQIIGKHKFVDAKRLEIRWQANVANTKRDELDTRDMLYTIDPSSLTRSYKDQPGSGQRYWSFLSDLSLGAGADAVLPLSSVRLLAGVNVQNTDRSFRGRRFRYRFIGEDTAARNLPAEKMLTQQSIGRDFQIEENTLHEDSYQANLGVAAAYAAAEWQAAESLRIITGLRFERAEQSLSNGSKFAIAGNRANISRGDNDPLPTVNAVYAINDNNNLRAAYSYTLARPRFRELAPFLYFDYVRRRSLSGNPDLKTTHIHNADLRWERFMGEDEVIAASVFYKRFQDPIEQVLADSESNASFRNARAANLMGVEFELRMSLQRLHRVLSAWRIGTNVAIMRSRIELPAQSMLLTSQSRPMYGQSPYVINANVEYRDPKYVDINVLYNVIGRRITDVGVEGLPDTYETPFHRLDIVAGKDLSPKTRLKVSVSNLLNQQVALTQDTITVDGYRPGLSMTVGIDWNP